MVYDVIALLQPKIRSTKNPMATFSASNSATAIYMDLVPQFGGSIIPTSTQITVLSGSQRQNYFGTFSYGSGNDVFGTLTSTEYTNASTGMNYSLSDLSYDAYTASKYVLGGSARLLAIDLLSGNDTITGTKYSDRLMGYSGNDVIRVTGTTGDTIDGGTGRDTVIFDYAKAGATISKTPFIISVGPGSPGTPPSLLSNIERIKFSDSALAFDIDGNAGQTYRLYQAALNRTPDLGGIGFQMNALDVGFSIQQIAQDFINSPEFQSKYGANLSNEDFVTQLYLNVLHRAPDSNGYSYQVNALNTGLSRAQLLVNFSESPENYSATLVGIQNGIEYLPYV